MSTVREKNECGKMRKLDNPYEVWRNEASGWEWRVLKKYQTASGEQSNAYARWFCAVQSPYTHGGWDYGDTYVKDVTGNAVKV